MRVPPPAVLADARAAAVTHRLDLDETHDEVLRLSLRPRGAVNSSALAASILSGTAVTEDVSSLDASQHGGVLSTDRLGWGSLVWSGLHIDSFRFRLKRDLDGAELRARLVPLARNPLVQSLPLLTGAARNDPVGADIEAIPGVLRRVVSEWAQPEGLCRQSATAFARMLLEQASFAARNGGRRHDPIDLVVVGAYLRLKRDR